ncbi:MAG: MBL fold metallo-hydrolase [Thermodesulfobacteriota bacterium]
MALNHEPRRIAPGVFMVGGPDLSDPRDCLCYLIQGQQSRVLIDCGAGPSLPLILDLATQAGGQAPTHLLATHAHIDHVGGAAELKRRTGCFVIAHRGDAEVLALGDDRRSAAAWYGLHLAAVAPDQVIGGDGDLALGPEHELHILYTPGHTPGSLSAWCQAGDMKVLFGQDVHGPFSPEFGSDKQAWRRSMQRLLELRADVLAEGHYGVFRPREEVEAFIQGQLEANP